MTTVQRQDDATHVIDPAPETPIARTETLVSDRERVLLTRFRATSIATRRQLLILIQESQYSKNTT